MSDVCPICGHAWTMPEVYYDADQADEPRECYVPVKIAATSAEAFEHLLTDQSDWSDHEVLRSGIREDWRYEGVVTVSLDDEPQPAKCHRFVFVPIVGPA